MDIFLILVATLFMILGLIGSLLPVLPGPLTSWIGLLLLHLTDTIAMDWPFLIITLVIAILVWLLDYIIPALGTKKLGGSRYGMVGTSIGLVIAIFFPILGVFGIVFWPFIGAFIGELLNNNNSNTAAKAAFGSFIGFLTSTLIKFIVTIIYLGLFISKIWDHSNDLF